MTLEEELLEQGFESKGPVAASEFSEGIWLLYSEEINRPANVQIINGKVDRGYMNKYLGTYRIYFK